MSRYESLVGQLMDIGVPEFGYQTKGGWPNYLDELELGPEDVSDLIRVATDPALYESEPDSDEDLDPYSATVHARRALGQLKAVEAVGPLLQAMDQYLEEDDFWSDEMPEILTMIGPGVIPETVAALNDPARLVWTRLACSTALSEIGQAYPELREACVQALTEALKRQQSDDDGFLLNGALIGDLTDLNAVESAEVIEQAFAADVVDTRIAGDWPAIRFELGLGPKPPGYLTAVEIERSMRLGFFPGDRPKRPSLDKVKKKRKAQQKARKRNRKRR